MARLIDADALVNVVETARNKARTLTGMDFVMVTKTQPTIDAIPVEWLREKMRGYASSLKSTETAALVMVMQMWQKEQEADIAQKLGIEPKEG